MTRSARLAAIALIGAAPVAAATSARHPAWMAGTWVWLNPGERFTASLCNADHNDLFNRNGTYEFLDGVGRWQINGDRLIQRVTATDDGDSAKVGDVTTVRFRRIGTRTMRILGKYPGTMVRCATQ